MPGFPDEALVSESVWLSSAFALTEEYFDGRAWEPLERYLQGTTFEEAYGGTVYITSGTAA